MQTSKAISTISYNTESWIIGVLTDLQKNHIASNWWYIFHNGEDGDKNHYHIRIELNRKMDTETIREMFVEPSDDKPLGCMPFRPSSLYDWLQYSIHNYDYLRNHNSLGEDGKIPYTEGDVVSAYPDQLERDFRKSYSVVKTTQQLVMEEFNKGACAYDIIWNVPQCSPCDVRILASIYTDYVSNEDVKELSKCFINSTGTV